MPITFPSADGTPTSANLLEITWSSVGVGLLLIIIAALIIFKWLRGKKRMNTYVVNNEVSRDFSWFFLFACFVVVIVVVVVVSFLLSFLSFTLPLFLLFSISCMLFFFITRLRHSEGQ